MTGMMIRVRVHVGNFDPNQPRYPREPQYSDTLIIELEHDEADEKKQPIAAEATEIVDDMVREGSLKPGNWHVYHFYICGRYPAV